LASIYIYRILRYSPRNIPLKYTSPYVGGADGLGELLGDIDLLTDRLTDALRDIDLLADALPETDAD